MWSISALKKTDISRQITLVNQFVTSITLDSKQFLEFQSRQGSNLPFGYVTHQLGGKLCDPNWAPTLHQKSVLLRSDEVRGKEKEIWKMFSRKPI